MFKIILLIVSMAIMPSFLAQTQSKSPDLFFSEIAFSGSKMENNCQKITNGVEIEGNKVGCGLDKWLEIANNSESNIDLQGYKIRLSYKDIEIKDSWVIPAKTVGILAAKNKNMTSSVDNLGLNIYKLGFLQGISSKEKSSLSVGLISPDGLILDSLVTTSEFGQSKTLEKNGEKWELATSQFLPNNYGTPGVFVFPLIKKTDVVKPAINPLPMIAPEISQNLAPEISPKPVAALEKTANVTQKEVQKEVQKEFVGEKKAVLGLPPDLIVEKTVAPAITLNTGDLALKNTNKVAVYAKVMSQSKQVEKQIAMPKIINYELEKVTLLPKKSLSEPISATNYAIGVVSSQKELYGFSHTSFEQVLSFGFLTILSLLQKIITKITKKCKAVFGYKLANK